MFNRRHSILLNRYKDIPGWLSDAEAKKLQQLAKDKVVLEIGCYQGRSAMAMAPVAKELYCLDHFKGDSFAGSTDPDTMLKYFRQNLSFENMLDKIVMVIGDASAVKWLSLSLFGFVYYDADHTAEAVNAIMEAWYDAHSFTRDLAMTCPPLAIHDYDLKQPQYAESVQAMDNFVKAHRLKAEVVDRLLVITVPTKESFQKE